jgi:hypothetical protein
VTLVVIILALAAWAILSGSLPKVRERWQRSKGVLVGGVLGGIAGFSGLASTEGRPHPFWFYLALFSFGGVAPIAAAYWLLRRWAMRERPQEWREVSQGAVGWAGISAPLRRAYGFAGMGSMLTIGAVLWVGLRMG